MRVSNWNIESQGAAIISESMRRMMEAAVVVREAAKTNALRNVWPGPWHGPYQKGKDKGKIWTARDHDNILRTIRVVEKKGQESAKSESPGNIPAVGVGTIWVMAGNYKTWYARLVEYGSVKAPPRKFLRKAVSDNRDRINAIMEGRG